jgi:hypothetical protein
MATESVEQAVIPADMYGAEPLLGNFTDDSEIHLWCANALSCVVSSTDAMETFNDNIQEALRYLLHREVSRAWQANKARA